jgi:RNA polymerase sigma-70 factor, ECF subfamily
MVSFASVVPAPPLQSLQVSSGGSPPPGHPRSGCAAVGACATMPSVSGPAPLAHEDLALLQRIAVRDEQALAELYDRHSALAYGLILRVLRDPADADDVLQETFVRVWSRADTYDPSLGSPAAWLTRIARNRAIDRLRAKRVRRDIAVDPGVTPEGQPAPLPEPEDHVTPERIAEDSATATALRAAMLFLPAAQRQLIEAAFFEGYTHNELATRFGVPLGTVKTRIRTGLTTMRGRLEQFA